ncbi:trans-2-enoyl-CoA reductase, partial [Tanacetum coccineum]
MQLVMDVMISSVVLEKHMEQITWQPESTVGLLGMGRSLQRDLNRIAEAADTSTPEGLSFVLQETTLSLLRHPDYCISGYSFVDVKRSVEEGEKRFNQLSIEVCLCYYNRPCEINDALEFSVNALQ